MSDTSPDTWFLYSTETPLQPAYSSNNRVGALIDGQRYMSELLTHVQNLNSGGYIHISGWRLTPQTRLLGNFAGSPTMEDVVREAVADGKTVRSLLWYVPGTLIEFAAGHGPENLEMVQIHDELGQEAVLDDRLPRGNFASHHQKFIVVGDDQIDIAFVGGIDIAPDRWDRADHDEPTGRQPEFFEAWHDIQAQVSGPAVAQIWDTFTDRWNDPRRPHAAPFTTGASTLSAISTADRPSSSDSGTCHVQLLHTFACRSSGFGNDDDFYPFAPGGIRTYERGLVKAIDAASHYVYIEDQYLWPCKIVDALADAARRGVTIIAVVTKQYDIPGFEAYHNFLRQSCIDQIESADSNRMFIYHLQQDDSDGKDEIYVHSKTLIIDDRYAVIGTANVNQRSMSTDTEIGVAVVDSDTIDGSIGGESQELCTFAHQYRKQLWEEHLGLITDDPLNADGTPRNWPNSPGTQVGHAVMHQVPEPRFCRPAFIPFTFMNPDTICP